MRVSLFGSPIMASDPQFLAPIVAVPDGLDLEFPPVTSESKMQ